MVQTQVTSISIPKQLRDQLKGMAKEQNRSFSNLVVYLVLKVIENSKDVKYETTDDGERVLKIMNKDGSTVRQIPSEVSLKIMKEIDNFLENRKNNDADQQQGNLDVTA
jgi:uncharacterized FlaG/YvyC family protein